MPSTQQIIPSYNVPHVKTYITDNSEVSAVSSVASTNPSISLLYVFASPKGVDGTVKLVTDTATYLKTYGTPNMALYGQAGYMPYQSLLTGNAKCYCVRVAPFDATYANIVITATITAEAAVGATAGSVSVEYAVKTITSYKQMTYDTLKTRADALAVGANEHVIMAFACRGRGAYGNNLGFRIATDTYYDENNDYKNYIFEIINNEDGVSREEYYRGTFISNSTTPDHRTLYIEDAVNDPETGSDNVTMYVNTTGIENIYAAFDAATAAGSTTAVTHDAFDLLFGYVKGSTSTTITNYTITESDVNFSTTTGIRLQSGDEGSFALTESDANRTTAINKEYCKAFYYGTDTEYFSYFTEKGYLAEGENSTVGRRYSGINSKRRTPVDAIIDANYANSTKLELWKLAKARMDSKLYLDSGINATYTALLNADNLISKDNENKYIFTDDYYVERFGQCYKTRDPFNNKVIEVTMTYALASMIPNHYINNGNQVPMVGENYALLTGMIAGSVRPNVDADDLATKEELYNRKINTVDTLSESKYIIATQVTSQSKTSDLSEGSNVNVLFDMKRRLENLVISKIYEFSEAEDRTRFTEDAEYLFSSYRNNKVRDFTVRFDMNEFEAERNILHCYLEVIFRQISTRGIIEIDINKRT